MGRNKPKGTFTYHFSDSSNGSKDKGQNKGQIKIIQSIGNEMSKIEDKIYDEDN